MKKIFILLLTIGLGGFGYLFQDEILEGLQEFASQEVVTEIREGEFLKTEYELRGYSKTNKLENQVFSLNDLPESDSKNDFGYLEEFTKISDLKDIEHAYVSDVPVLSFGSSKIKNFEGGFTLGIGSSVFSNLYDYEFKPYLFNQHSIKGETVYEKDGVFYSINPISVSKQVYEVSRNLSETYYVGTYRKLETQKIEGSKSFYNPSFNFLNQINEFEKESSLEFNSNNFLTYSQITHFEEYDNLFVPNTFEITGYEEKHRVIRSSPVIEFTVVLGGLNNRTTGMFFASGNGDDISKTRFSFSVSLNQLQKVMGETQSSQVMSGLARGALGWNFENLGVDQGLDRRFLSESNSNLAFGTILTEYDRDIKILHIDLAQFDDDIDAIAGAAVPLNKYSLGDILDLLARELGYDNVHLVPKNTDYFNLSSFNPNNHFPLYEHNDVRDFFSDFNAFNRVVSLTHSFDDAFIFVESATLSRGGFNEATFMKEDDLARVNNVYIRSFFTNTMGIEENRAFYYDENKNIYKSSPILLSELSGFPIHPSADVEVSTIKEFSFKAEEYVLGDETKTVERVYVEGVEPVFGEIEGYIFEGYEKITSSEDETRTFTYYETEDMRFNDFAVFNFVSRNVFDGSENIISNAIEGFQSLTLLSEKEVQFYEVSVLNVDVEYNDILILEANEDGSPKHGESVFKDGKEYSLLTSEEGREITYNSEILKVSPSGATKVSLTKTTYVWDEFITHEEKISFDEIPYDATINIDHFMDKGSRNIVFYDTQE